MEMIRLDNISKQYDGKTILNKVDKVFHKGESIAFMGHNGCGKSTLLKILAKLIAPNSGTVIYDKPLLFHYIPEKFKPTALTARSYLMRMCALDGLLKNEATNKIEALGNDFFLSELLDSPMTVLSKGTLQKISVIQAFLKKPDVLLLDEPLSGQDTASQKIFIDKVNQLRAQDVTIFMSCHEQRLVDAVAEVTYTIQNGSLMIYKPEQKKIYTILLENEGHVQPPDNMVRYGRFYKIKVDEAQCDYMLSEWIQTGWKLRGMYDEEDN